MTSKVTLVVNPADLTALDRVRAKVFEAEKLVKMETKTQTVRRALAALEAQLEAGKRS